ncbi:MAG: deoxyribose-phosphate aldolase [Promethearchaeota archaeon]
MAAEEWTRAKLAKLIDHTILKPEATPAQVKQVCREAVEYGFASVCVNPAYVPLVVTELAGSGIPACSVVGFPLGATPPDVKAAEASWVVSHGAREVDVVINVGMLKVGALDAVRGDVRSVVVASKRAGSGDVVVKVIIETCLLTREEKVLACQLARQAGAEFVKTSTGFNSGGATVEDVRLMRETVGDSMGVKASGGIRTLQAALSMIEAGASRLGASAGVSIVNELPE